MDGDFARIDMLHFIESFWERNGYAPSFRDIQEGVGFASVASVAQHLSVLRDLGKVEYMDNIARSVRVIK